MSSTRRSPASCNGASPSLEPPRSGHRPPRAEARTSVGAVEGRGIYAGACPSRTLLRGAHQGTWRGPGDRHGCKFEACVVLTVDDEDRLRGEAVYFDRRTVLTQRGVISVGQDPNSCEISWTWAYEESSR